MRPLLAMLVLAQSLAGQQVPADSTALPIRPARRGCQGGAPAATQERGGTTLTTPSTGEGSAAEERTP